MHNGGSKLCYILVDKIIRISTATNILHRIVERGVKNIFQRFFSIGKHSRRKYRNRIFLWNILSVIHKAIWKKAYAQRYKAFCKLSPKSSIPTWYSRETSTPSTSVIRFNHDNSTLFQPFEWSLANSDRVIRRGWATVPWFHFAIVTLWFPWLRCLREERELGCDPGNSRPPSGKGDEDRPSVPCGLRILVC